MIDVLVKLRNILRSQSVRNAAWPCILMHMALSLFSHRVHSLADFAGASMLVEIGAAVGARFGAFRGRHHFRYAY